MERGNNQGCSQIFLPNVLVDSWESMNAQKGGAALLLAWSIPMWEHTETSCKRWRSSLFCKLSTSFPQPWLHSHTSTTGYLKIHRPGVETSHPLSRGTAKEQVKMDNMREDVGGTFLDTAQSRLGYLSNTCSQIVTKTLKNNVLTSNMCLQDS